MRTVRIYRIITYSASTAISKRKHGKLVQYSLQRKTAPRHSYNPITKVKVTLCFMADVPSVKVSLKWL